MKLGDLLQEREGDGFSEGYFKANDKFVLSPGGGWSMGFRKDSIIKIVGSGNQAVMSSWNAIKQEWVNRHPPFSNLTSLEPNAPFSLSNFGGGGSQMLKTFTNATTEISKSQAESEAKNMVAEKTLKVRDAIKLLQKMQGSDNVKITMIK